MVYTMLQDADKMRVWTGSYTYIDVGEREWFRDATAPFHSPLLLERLMTPAANLNLCMTLVCMRMWCTSNILSSASCGNKVSTQALWKPWVVQGKPGFLDSLIPNKGVDVVSPGVFVTAANDK